MEANKYILTIYCFFYYLIIDLAALLQIFFIMLFYFIETLMVKFLIKKPRINASTFRDKSPIQSQVEINLNELESDPSLWKKITSYKPKDMENVRRAYLLRGRTQPDL